MRKRKFESIRSLAKKRHWPIKFIVISVIILLAAYFATRYIGNSLKDSDFFKIKDIIARGVEAELDLPELSYLKDKNIFTVNLKKESKYILESYPNFKAIRLVRVFPNRIFVDFIKRSPVALVKLYRFFAVDEKGVLFYAQDLAEPYGLPVIMGLETKIFGPKSGKRYDTEGLMLALNIIKEIKRNKVLKKYNINKIDVARLKRASVSIPLRNKDIVVKLGDDDIRDKIKILGSLFIQLKKDLANTKYIDLRFKEPVIKLRDAK